MELTHLDVKAQKVGYTCEFWWILVLFTMSQNASAKGVAWQAKGTKRGGSADVQRCYPSCPGPQIVLKPNVVCSAPETTRLSFPIPRKSRSTLVVTGTGVTIDSLDHDGALVGVHS